MDICVTGTGFHGYAREELRRLAELLGMQYSPALIRNHTTHLVLASEALELNEDNPRSQKLESARSWGIALTHYAWLKDSLAKGKVLDAQEYIMQHSLESSFSTLGGVHSGSWTPEQLRAAHVPPAEPSEQLWSSGQASSGPADEAECLSGHSIGMHLEGQQQRPLRRRGNNRFQSTQGSFLLPELLNEQTSLEEEGPMHTTPYSAMSSRNLSESGESCTTSAGHCRSSPEHVHVHVDRPLKKCPKGSTAAAFHGISKESLTYYEKLTIRHSSSSTALHFNLRERSHCALVYYEDANSEELELAYADILYCYSLEGGDIYIEHGYLFDRQDLEQHPMGRIFLESNQVADAELVDSSGVYHSLTSVIEGDFWLTSRRKAELTEHNRAQGQSSLFYFCEKAWDRKTGRCICVSRYKLKCRQHFVRG